LVEANGEKRRNLMKLQAEVSTLKIETKFILIELNLRINLNSFIIAKKEYQLFNLVLFL
jgi:hypothetical protein